MSVVELSAEAVRGFLPHRGHALFVEGACVDGESIKGDVVWAADHPVLQGHFPGLPIVPGVFLIEAAAQLGGVWIASTHRDKTGLGMLASVRRALVHQPLPAGTGIRYALKVAASGASFFSVSGVGSLADGQKVVTLDLVIAVRPNDATA